MTSAVSTGGGPSSWRWAKRWVVDPAGCCSPIRRATASSSTSGPRTTRTASQAVRRYAPWTCTNTLIAWTTARRQPSTSMRSWRTSGGATWRHCTRHSRRLGEKTFATEPTHELLEPYRRDRCCRAQLRSVDRECPVGLGVEGRRTGTREVGTTAARRCFSHRHAADRFEGEGAGRRREGRLRTWFLCDLQEDGERHDDDGRPRPVG